MSITQKSFTQGGTGLFARPLSYVYVLRHNAMYYAIMSTLAIIYMILVVKHMYTYLQLIAESYYIQHCISYSMTCAFFFFINAGAHIIFQ
jgi:hypothetical protein